METVVGTLAGVWAVSILLACVITAIATVGRRRVPKPIREKGPAEIRAYYRTVAKGAGKGGTPLASPRKGFVGGPFPPISKVGGPFCLIGAEKPGNPKTPERLRDALEEMVFVPNESQMSEYLEKSPDAPAEEVLANAGDLVYPHLTEPDRTPKVKIAVYRDTKGVVHYATLALCKGSPARVVAKVSTKLTVDETSGASVRRGAKTRVRVLRGVEKDSGRESPDTSTWIATEYGLADDGNARNPRNIPIYGNAGVVRLKRMPNVGSVGYATIADQMRAVIKSVNPGKEANLPEKPGLSHLLAETAGILRESAIEASDATSIIQSFADRVEREENEKAADTRKRADTQYDTEASRAVKAVLKARHRGTGKPVYVGTSARTSISRKLLPGGKDGGTWVPNVKTGLGWLNGGFEKIPVGAFEREAVKWQRKVVERNGVSFPDLVPTSTVEKVVIYATLNRANGEIDGIETARKTDSPAAIKWRRGKIVRAEIDRINGWGVDNDDPISAGIIPGSRCGRCRMRLPPMDSVAGKHLKECGARNRVTFPTVRTSGAICWNPWLPEWWSESPRKPLPKAGTEGPRESLEKMVRQTDRIVRNANRAGPAEVNLLIRARGAGDARIPTLEPEKPEPAPKWILALKPEDSLPPKYSGENRRTGWSRGFNESHDVSDNELIDEIRESILVDELVGPDKDAK